MRERSVLSTGTGRVSMGANSSESTLNQRISDLEEALRDRDAEILKLNTILNKIAAILNERFKYPKV